MHTSKRSVDTAPSEMWTDITSRTENFGFLLNYIYGIKSHINYYYCHYFLPLFNWLHFPMFVRMRLDPKK